MKPPVQAKRYLIVGSGKVARHFCHYLSLMGGVVKQIHRLDVTAHFSNASRQFFRDFEPPDHILILIRDDGIVPFIEEHVSLFQSLCRADQKLDSLLIHFSGSLQTHYATGLHPLFTFSETLYDLDVYKSIAFIGEKDRPSFSQVFPQLSNPHTCIPGDIKPLYHALCVLSGNFTTLLWEKMFTTFETKLGISRSMAFPYLETISQNLLTSKFGVSVLTGPVQREDQATIKKNMEALSGDPYKDIYHAFLMAHAPHLIPSSQGVSQ